jgi:hypothetical protein
MPATMEEVLKNQPDYYTKIPPGCEQLKKVPEYLKDRFQIMDTEK